jgi:hypothetical protein
MRRLSITTLALVLTATPALAHWGASRWGMTPEQVIKAVPGAAAEPYDPDGTISGLHLLAQAPASEGAIQLRARFYFEPDSQKLQMVDLLPVDPSECPAFRDAIVARLGKTEVARDIHKTPRYDAVSVSMRWTDKASGDTLIWAGLLLPNSETEFGICKLIQRNSK